VKYSLIWFFVTILFVAGNARAEMYKWVDSRGVVTFKDTPPPASKKRPKVKVYRDDDFDQPPPPSDNAPARVPASPASGTTAGAANVSTEQAAGKTIEIFVTDWCPVCKKAIAYMTKKNYPFVAYDVEKDKAAMKRFEENGGRGVPLIIVGNKKMSGFSPDVLDQYLGNR